ncbi:MAG: 16S rRNA (guanine(966)-N(2))-methyltransferase RsmD [Coprothermobacterota bacterium]|nr:16S rRNA (guanine(966)-N(2))-methyltransferase RsmD [Coprothermobacterota bacterium]
MRIYSGSEKGRRLHSRRSPGLRPTSDKVKEALFNILAGRVAGASFLDLFAGTGNIGLEALSRGAALCVFVERSRAGLALLRRNLQSTGLVGTVLAMEVKTALVRLEEKGLRFRLVFLDPPYERGLIAPTLTALDRSSLLEAGAIIVAEHSLREEAGALGLSKIRTYRYGDTALTLWQQSG